MVNTAKKRLVSRIFPGQNNYIPGQGIQDLKIINQDIYEKISYLFNT